MNTARQVVTDQIQREIERMEEIEADALAIRMRLPEWGYWCRCFDAGLNGPRQITAQWSPKGWPATDLQARIPRIPDDQALAIDAAIAALGHPYSEAVKKVYLNLESYRTLTRYWQRQHCVAIGKLSMVLPN